MKIGMAFSGGGVKGAAHIGVLKAFKENGITIHAVAGTSSGSIVAALFAMDYTPDEMIKLFRYFSKDILKVDPKFLVNHVRQKRGIRFDGAFSSINVELALNEAAKYKGVNYLQELKVPIAIPTVDINTSKKYVFTNGTQREDYYIRNIEIGKAVRASCSYPGVFEPCDYQEYRFVDGGVLDNVPADEVKKLGVDKIISSKFILGALVKPRGMYNIALKCVDTIFEGMASEAVRLSDFVLDINVNKASAFSLNQIDYCYNKGYQYALTKIPELRKILKEEE